MAQDVIFVRSVLGVRKVPEFELRKFLEFERLFQLPEGNLSGGSLSQKLLVYFLLVVLPVSHCEALKREGSIDDYYSTTSLVVNVENTG